MAIPEYPDYRGVSSILLPAYLIETEMDMVGSEDPPINMLICAPVVADTQVDKSQHNDYVVLEVIPSFQSDGNLPPGVHSAQWSEITLRFGLNPHRRRLLAGLHRALVQLAAAGCETAYLDGSFVSETSAPSDFDGAWELNNVDLQRLFVLEPLFFDFSNQRAAQKSKYFGELFPADTLEVGSGRTFLEFFQQDKDTGAAKGIVAIDLRTL